MWIRERTRGILKLSIFRSIPVDSDMETAVSFSALQDTVHERKNEEQEETPSGSMPCVEMTGQNQKHHMAVGRFRTK
jgi:hypothetical protein